MWCQSSKLLQSCPRLETRIGIFYLIQTTRDLTPADMARRKFPRKSLLLFLLLLHSIFVFVIRNQKKVGKAVKVIVMVEKTLTSA
jgi:hypothetical protein